MWRGRGGCARRRAPRAAVGINAMPANPALKVSAAVLSAAFIGYLLRYDLDIMARKPGEPLLRWRTCSTERAVVVCATGDQAHPGHKHDPSKGAPPCGSTPGSPLEGDQICE